MTGKILDLSDHVYRLLMA